METREHHELVDVCPCSSEFEAEVILGYLRECGIEARCDSNLFKSLYGLTADYVVFVHEDDADRAQALLAHWKPPRP